MNECDAPTYFGEWLKRRRQRLDLTQADLAERAGCSVFALRKIEAGERRPSKQLAELLAQALQIEPAETAAFVRAARGELASDRLPRSAPRPLSRCPSRRHRSPRRCTIGPCRPRRC